MPQFPVLVYEKDSGDPTYMHSVDAKEAVQLGDYTYAPAGTKEGDSEARAAAMAKFQAGLPVLHPEMQTEEQREETRRKANEKAELLATVPEGAQVVVMAPAPPARASSAAPRSTASASGSRATPQAEDRPRRSE